MRPGVRGRVQGHRLSERDKPQLVITFDAKSHEKNRWPRCSFLADFTNGVTLPRGLNQKYTQSRDAAIIMLKKLRDRSRAKLKFVL